MAYLTHLTDLNLGQTLSPNSPSKENWECVLFMKQGNLYKNTARNMQQVLGKWRDKIAQGEEWIKVSCGVAPNISICL